MIALSAPRVRRRKSARPMERAWTHTPGIRTERSRRLQVGSLVIGRNRNESVVITAGEHMITVQVVEISGRGMRLRIEAPHAVVIQREELLQAAPEFDLEHEGTEVTKL
jgi:carbon storage regulator CsrA